MAIEYHIYTDLNIETLTSRTEAAAKGTQDLWEGWWVNDDLGPFHEEIMEDYGDQKGYKTRMTSRHFKDRSVEARARLIEFFDSLPGRKLILNGDSFVDYRKS
ncbi:hypothetical protein MUY35_11385 [Aliiroseovarius sp. S1339]|uniref:hypothetical protein n=1 Tax=Aliiroseovarius sp. S1339 TaxID=2936990 RepID=UPI0020BD7777|nr:hypothetical protein [Aliiroseovarius sp. S1339]MCK8464455.1 hypothetical protein [Aliiroseovarius sp. S1339]